MFDALLQPPPVDRRRPLVFAAAGAAHAGAVALAVAASFVVVEAVQEPDLMLTFVGLAGPPGVPAPAPPPPKGAPRPSRPAEADRPKPPTNEVLQPAAVERLTRADLERRIEEEADGEGVPDGDPNGVPGGTGTSGASGFGLLGDGLGLGGGSAPAPPDEPRIITADMTPPELISRVEPDYPEIARRARKEGKVILRAVIAESGAVESVQVQRSVTLLDEAAVEAVQKWRYRPARLDGQPIRVYLTVVVTFQLQ